MRPIVPHLHLVDYCLWFITVIVIASVPLPFLTSEVATFNVIIAAGTILGTSLGLLAIILFRGGKVRRMSRELSQGGALLFVPFDSAQLQEVDGRPLRDFDGGCLSIEPGGAYMWLTQQRGSHLPVLDIKGAEIVEIHAERIIPFGCYPLLVVTLSDSKVLRVRPLKPRWPSWRIGMNRRETQMTIDALSRTVQGVA